MIQYSPADVRGQIRLELSDTQRPYTWSDTRLDTLVLSATRQIGTDAPQRRQFLTQVSDDLITIPFTVSTFSAPANLLSIDFGTIQQGRSAGSQTSALSFTAIDQPTPIRVYGVQLQPPAGKAYPIPPGPAFVSLDTHQCYEYDPSTDPTIRLRLPVAPATLARVEYLAGLDYSLTTDTATAIYDQEYYEGVTALACSLAEKRLTDSPAGTGQTSGVRSDHRFDALYQAWLIRHKRRKGVQSGSLTTDY